MGFFCLFVFFVTRGKIWSKEDVPSVEEDQNELDTCKFMGCDEMHPGVLR